MELWELFILLLVVGLLVSAVVLPPVAIVLIILTRRRVRQLEALLIEQVATPRPARAPAPAPEPAPEAEREPEPPRVVWPTPEPAPPPPQPEPPPPDTTPPPPTRPAHVPSLNAFEIESIIGRRWVGWAAIGLILFATAFFLKYAFDNRWIGEVGRVAIGITFGIAMSLAGFRYRKKGWRVFSQILTAGGIVLLYLSTYAAFGYYHLVGQKTAFFFLAILIAEAAAIALIYNAPAIAIMALIGGFLTPVLLHSGRDQYRSFFMYLVALDVGALALLKHWRGLSSVAYFGTQFLFWIWYDENYHHQKRPAVLIFQTAIFLIFLLAHLIRELLGRGLATLEDAVLVVVNPFVFFATAYHLLNPTHHDWMGAFAIGMALLYAGAAEILLRRNVQSRREILLLIAVALTFVTIAIPIQLRSNWITIAWAVQGLVILWAALEIRSARLRAHAFALFALAFFKLLFWDTPYGYRPTFIPIFNRYFLSSLAVIACFLGAIYVFERASKRKLFEPGLPQIVIGLAAVLAFWYVISIETHTYFTGRAIAAGDAAGASQEGWLGQMALSVVWATYAGALAAVGFVRRVAVIRWAALVIFAVTIVKAMLVDIAGLEQLYRIIVFFVLGILLLAVAWGYHRAFHSRESTK